MEPDDTNTPTDGWARLCEGVLRTNFGRIESNAVAGAMEALALEETRRQKQSRQWLLKIAAILILSGVISWGVSARWQSAHPKSKEPAPMSDSTARTPVGSGSILLETWGDVPGDTVASLTNSAKFKQAADQLRLLRTVEGPSIETINFGDRIRGWLNPAVSGVYEFWIASDDSSELWLSPDAEPGQKHLIAQVDRWTPDRAWDFSASQHSSPIPLEAGRKYYFEVLHKQGWARSHLSVAWSAAGRPREIVDERFVIPYQTDPQ